MESFIDYPEMITYQIVETALNNGYLYDSVESHKGISTVCNAYSSTLSSIRCTRLLALNNYEDLITSLLPRLLKLDLSGCELSDSHDIIRSVASHATR